MKNKYMLFIAMAVFSLLFYQVFLKDYFAYLKVGEIRTEEACQNYLNMFPGGYYVEDVRFIELSVVREMNLVTMFLANYPNSRYLQEVNQIKNEIWNSKIEIYKERVKQKSNNKVASEFFISMMTYMKENNIYSINFRFKPQLQLKDYEDYSIDIQTMMDNYYPPLQKLSYSFSTPSESSVKDCILPLKSNFSQGEINTLQEIVAKGIQTSLDSIFSPDLITISSNDSIAKLSINIDYMITNQEITIINKKIPLLWVLVKETQIGGLPTNRNEQNYMLGIAIRFRFDYTLPETGLNYSFVKHFDPTEDILGIQGIGDGYGRMTQMVFEKFANSISSSFGLDAGYRTGLPEETVYR